MERVGGTQRSRLQREQEMFRSAVDVPCQLDAVVDPLVEAREDRVLKSPRSRRADFGYGQIGYEDILSSLSHFVELVASGFGQVQLQQRAGVREVRADSPDRRPVAQRAALGHAF